MNESEFKQFVEYKLLQLPFAHRINYNQIALRCQFCGDSKKDPRKTRFYVQTNVTNDKPILYNCFNCGESGILTPSVLRTFDINDLSLNSSLITFNKNIQKKFNKIYNIKDNKFNYKVPIGRDGTSDVIKKKYIEDRLGLSFTFEELQKLKVIFSLEQLLAINEIDKVTVNSSRANSLNDDYVGFLSVRNEFIIFRDITNNNKLRYDKYSIMPSIDNTRKFYTIPNKIDILTNEPIYINLAEGTFDILGVFYHIKNKQLHNQIYTAVCGSAYTSVIKYFISTGLVGDNIIINIFSDNDKDEYWYSKMVKEISPFVNSINIYYNTKSKDYGVHKDKIDLIQSKKNIQRW